jgi:hypothetical protein
MCSILLKGEQYLKCFRETDCWIDVFCLNRKLRKIWLKPIKMLIITCHDLKVVVIQVADIPGFSRISIFLTTLQSGLHILSIDGRKVIFVQNAIGISIG